MRTRENSVIVSLRVERELQREFLSLASELGDMPARRLREGYISIIEKMREQVNEKRRVNGLSPLGNEIENADS